MTDPNNASTFTQVKSVSVSTADYQEYTVDFSTYTGEGIYIAFKLNPPYSSYSYTYFSIDDITVEEIPSCLVPTDLEATINGANEATLSWTTGGAETVWNVQYKMASESDWSEPIAVNETSYTLTGLQRATAYEARVQTICNADDQSDWTNPISFTTECGIWTIDAQNALIEDFHGETFPPDCWQKVNFNEMGITNGWLQSFNNPLDNQGAVSSDFKYETWLFLPAMHLNGNAFLSFDHLFGSGNDYIPSSIMVSTSTDMDVEDIKTTGFIDANFTQIWTANASNRPSTRKNEIVSSSAYNGENVYVAFRYEGTYNYQGKIWYIDNVEVYVNATQTVQLSQGWNWWSSSVDVTLQDLESALGTNGITIKSQTESVTYEDEEWLGDNFTLIPGKMYKIKVSADCEFVLTGKALSSISVVIEPGYNWFGYTGTQTISLEDALYGFEPEEGDIIKSLDDSSTFEDGEWIGDIINLQPGHGYVYISNGTESKTITFH